MYVVDYRLQRTEVQCLAKQKEKTTIDSFVFILPDLNIVMIGVQNETERYIQKTERYASLGLTIKKLLTVTYFEYSVVSLMPQIVIQYIASLVLPFLTLQFHLSSSCNGGNPHDCL